MTPYLPFDAVSEEPRPLEVPNPVKKERDRLNATARRLLAFLQERQGQWIDNAVLLEVAGFRFGGRIYELKQDGWLIDRRHVEGGCWQYALIGRKSW